MSNIIPPSSSSGGVSGSLGTPTLNALIQAQIDDGAATAQNIINTLKTQGFTSAELSALESSLAAINGLSPTSNSNASSNTGTYNNAIQSFTVALQSLTAKYPTITFTSDEMPAVISQTTGTSASGTLQTQDFSGDADSILQGYISTLTSAKQDLSSSQSEAIDNEIANLNSLTITSPMSSSDFSSFLSNLQGTTQNINSVLTINGIDTQLTSYAATASSLVLASMTQLCDTYDNLTPADQQSYGGLINGQLQTLADLLNPYALPSDSSSFSDFLGNMQSTLTSLNGDLSANNLNTDLVCYTANAYNLVEGYITQMNSSFSDLSASAQTSSQQLFTTLQGRLTSLLQNLSTDPLTSSDAYNSFTEQLQTTLQGINTNLANNDVDIQIVPYTSNASLLVSNLIGQLQANASNLSSSQQEVVQSQINILQNYSAQLATTPLATATEADTFLSNLQNTIGTINSTLSANGISTQIDATAVNVQLTLVTDMISISTDQTNITQDQANVTTLNQTLSADQTTASTLQTELTAAQAAAAQAAPGTAAAATQAQINQLQAALNAANAQVATDQQNLASATSALASDTNTLAAAKNQLIADLTSLIPPNTANFLQQNQLILQTTLMFETQNDLFQETAKLDLAQTTYNSSQDAIKQLLAQYPDLPSTSSAGNAQYVQLTTQSQNASNAVNTLQQNVNTLSATLTTQQNGLLANGQQLLSSPVSLPTTPYGQTLLNQVNVYSSLITNAASTAPGSALPTLSWANSQLSGVQTSLFQTPPQSESQANALQTTLSATVTNINTTLQTSGISLQLPDPNTLQNNIANGTQLFTQNGLPINMQNLPAGFTTAYSGNSALGPSINNILSGGS